ncbi:MAG: hypothetical protein RBT71_11420 [Flavobacteriales bacterium]|jgi:hypothetical protein|nr:hypothetical protein [Flavobacteriales bacterium]
MSNAIALRSLLSTIILAPALAAAQPWSYDFGDPGGAALPPNTVSTTFFPGTPPGGGTYRARAGNQGGGIALVAPGTSLGSGAEVQLTAATGTSTNKFGVYSWDATGRTAMVGFKWRTTATGNGTLAFNLGNAISASSNNTISGVQTQSLALVRLVYAGGELTVDRREGGAYVPVPAGAFTKDTDHEVVVVGNANGFPQFYRHLGEDRVLHAHSWDLYVDGERVSPVGGWSRAGTFNNDLAGFSFFGESSPANNAMLMVDDLWHTPELPAAQNVLYHHDFGTATGTFPHPYMAAPPVIAPHLTDAGWSNNLGTWNNVAGVTGRAIGRNVNAGTHTYALALDVDPGHMVRIDDLSFHWDRGTASGVQAWSIAIDDVTVRTGQVVGNDWEWSGMGPFAQPVVVADGRVDLVISLTGSTANTAFNIDEFRLFGEVLSAGGPLLAVSTFALDPFGPQVVGGSTAAQSFDVSGTDLVPAAGQVTVDVPGGTGFEISLDGVDWATTLQLPYAAGTLAPTAVMVRYAPMAPGIQSGLATVQGGGAEPLTVALSGQGVLHAPVTIYHHNFGTQIISGSPYTVSPLATTVPGVLADGLGNSSIASSTGTWDHNGGVTGYGIRMFPGTDDHTLELSLDVAEGLEVEVTGCAFWMQRAGGSQHWSVTIEGVPVASGGPVGTGWNPIGPLPVPSVMVTDGQLNMTIHLTEGTSNAGLTFDDLMLFGHVGPAGGDVVWYS